MMCVSSLYPPHVKPPSMQRLQAGRARSHCGVSKLYMIGQIPKRRTRRTPFRRFLHVLQAFDLPATPTIARFRSLPARPKES